MAKEKKPKKVDEGTLKLAGYMADAVKSPEYIEACGKGMRENVNIGGRVWLAGVGPAQAPVMVVTAIATADEVSEKIKVGMNWDTMEPRYAPKKPRAFESPLHLAYKDLAMQRGLDLDKCFCVPMIRFYPDMHLKAAGKPTAAMLKMFLPILEADIRRVKPAIVVCADKLVFNSLIKVPGIQFNEEDLYGAWFYNKDLNVRVYLTKKYTMVDKIDYRQRFLYDFGAVKAELEAMDGKRIERMPVNTTVARDAAGLRALVERLSSENRTVLSVDCEWEGSHHVDGKLRSLQIAWSDTDAAYIRFMDDRLNYAMDVGYKEAGSILSEWLDRPEVRYIGHHLSADLVWMHHVLGLQYRGKGLLDTEFAVQACDESRELGLDVLALTYTDLGKYDMDLIVWKKKHADLVKDGYGRIPDDIMIPYAVKDVIAVYRAWPHVQSWLEKQGLVEYWQNVLGPMVMDVFTYLCLVGIPIDHARIDEMRELYTWARDEYAKEFASEVVAESEELMQSALKEAGCEWMYPRIKDEMDLGHPETVKLLAAASGSKKVEATALHYITAPVFKPSSPDQMRVWLFDVKGYIPLKTTSLKDQGMPAMSWEKIMAKPPEEQAKYTPSTDQATLETLAARYGDKVLESLLQYKKICTVCKNFLKEPERGKDGQVVREGGMHYWIASDDAIHGMLSTTETGRIRSWNPNVLNWSGYVHGRLASAVEKTLTLRAGQGRVPDNLKKYVGVKGKNLPTIRSVSMSRPGWCMVEADLQTAEMRGLAFISGDLKFLDMLMGVDHDFAFIDDKFVPDGVDPGECIVRTSFPEYIEYPENKDKFLYAMAAGGEVKYTFTPDQLARNADGEIKRPRQDMH